MNGSELGAELALDLYQQRVRERETNDLGACIDVDRGDDAYKHLLAKLRGNAYEAEMGFLASVNAGLVGFFKSYTINYNYRRSRGAERVKHDRLRSSVFSLMVGLLVRLLNYQIWVFPIVVLSLFALRCKVPRMFWDVLSAMRILYSHKHTRVIATDLGELAMDPRSIPAFASTMIMLAVYDNCLHKFGTKYEHVKTERCNDNYQTCNWLTRWLPSTYDDEIRTALLLHRRGWSDEGAPLRVLDALVDLDAFAEYRDSVWIFFSDVARASSDGKPCYELLHHPNFDPPGADPIIFQHHVPTTTGTAAYDDNKIVLAKCACFLYFY
jgi:hypothetical protein